jgi:uncharacterized phosphosugar-binding protein
MSAEIYLKEVQRILNEVVTTQMESIHKAAKIIADSIIKGRVVHLFGTGHSNLLAMEGWYRAGGLMAANAILDPDLSMLFGGLRSTRVERISGYAEAILEDYDVQPGDTIIIISNSGRNIVPIEMAILAKERGLTVVALTSVNHSSQEPSRHPSGKRLFELADIVLDNRGVFGDAIVQFDSLPPKVGPTSGTIGAAIINALMVQVIKDILDQGAIPPVGYSSNIDGADEYNIALLQRYRGKVKHL